jgi:hypothetical protein
MDVSPGCKRPFYGQITGVAGIDCRFIGLAPGAEGILAGNRPLGYGGDGLRQQDADRHKGNYPEYFHLVLSSLLIFVAWSDARQPEDFLALAT